jgi:hypothetical protein
LLINTFNEDAATDFVLQESSLTLTHAICGTPLATLEKASRKETASKLIFLINRLNDLINVGQKLNDLQTATLASDLLDFCQNETLEDIVMLLKMARKGELGAKIYRLDAMVIFQEWLPVYLDLKYKERERALERNKSARAAEELEATKEKWNVKSLEAIQKIRVGLITHKAKPIPPKEDYLQNSTNFQAVFKRELKEISTKELKKLKKQYKLRQSHQVYLQLVKDELKSRVKPPLKRS